VVITINDYTQDQDFTNAALVLDSLGEPAVPYRRIAGLIEVPGWLDLASVRWLHRAATQGSKWS